MHEHMKFQKFTNDDSEHPLWSHFDTGLLAHTLRLRDCKCQWLVTQTQSHMGSEMEPAKREDRMTGQTLVSCLTHSVSVCQSLDMFEALLYHFMHF